jgi:hypothetical protein
VDAAVGHKRSEIPELPLVVAARLLLGRAAEPKGFQRREVLPPDRLELFSVRTGISFEEVLQYW